VKIGKSAFFRNNLTCITIPDSVRYIRAFAFCFNKIIHLDLGSGIEKIGCFCFAYNKLSLVILPESMKVVSSFAFLGNLISDVCVKKRGIHIREFAFCLNRFPIIRLTRLQSNRKNLSLLIEEKKYQLELLDNKKREKEEELLALMELKD